MTLGQMLKRARTEAGMSLRDLERAAKISNGYISLLESDSVKQPSPRHLHDLAKALGLDYSQLMQLAGYVAPAPVSSLNTQAEIRDSELGDLTEAERREVTAFVRGLRASRGILKRK